jgi:hypothetical protein
MQNNAEGCSLSVVRSVIRTSAWTSHHQCETHWPGPLRIAEDEHNHSLFALKALSNTSSSEQVNRLHAEYHISSMWLQL